MTKNCLSLLEFWLNCVILFRCIISARKHGVSCPVPDIWVVKKLISPAATSCAPAAAAAPAASSPFLAARGVVGADCDSCGRKKRADVAAKLVIVNFPSNFAYKYVMLEALGLLVSTVSMGFRAGG